MAKGPTKEKPTPLGDRVYLKHRKMIKDLEKKLRTTGRAEIVRRAIEEMHVRYFSKAA